MKLSKHLILFLMTFTLTLMPGRAADPIPITVNRSTVNSGGTVALPLFTASGTAINANSTFGGSQIVTFLGLLPPVVNENPPHFTITRSIGTGSPAKGTSVNDFPGGASLHGVSVTAQEYVTIHPDAPTVFTQSIHLIFAWGGPDVGVLLEGDPSYVFTIADDTGSGGSVPTLFVTGKAEGLLNLSRKISSTEYRPLMEFAIHSNTSATLKSMAFLLSNTSTNLESGFGEIGLFRDRDGGGLFDEQDERVATLSHGAGMTVFSGLNLSMDDTPQTLFLAASFNPEKQDRNSFLSASLHPQNITAIIADTDTPLVIQGTSILGRQYAFLDATTEEDEAAASLLSQTIGSAISATMSGLDRQSHSSESDKESGFEDSILPAVAAGAAGIGAAFTSDQLKEKPTSREFQPQP